MRIAWLSPDDPADRFPNVETALCEPDGLLAAGGDLAQERLLAAYTRGIFPWYDDGQPILWWSPDPRCVLRPERLRISRRLSQYARASNLVLHFNTAFGEVIRACAGERKSQQGTWITEQMIAAYEDLHAAGWAHSIEVSNGDDLVGGLYGLCIGRVFFGESMFSRIDNASKFAMIGLASHMLAHDIELIDCQVVSQHLMTIGAETIPRREFTSLLGDLCDPATRLTDWPTAAVAIADAFQDWRSAALH